MGRRLRRRRRLLQRSDLPEPHDVASAGKSNRSSPWSRERGVVHVLRRAGARSSDAASVGRNAVTTTTGKTCTAIGVRSLGDLVGTHRSVLRGEPTANGEARQLRQVRRGRAARCSIGVTCRSTASIEIAGIAETMNHRKPSRGPENPQRPYAGPLRISTEKMRWSGPYGDMGRLAKRQPAYQERAPDRSQVTDPAKFLVG